MGKFFTCWEPVSFSWITLLREVSKYLIRHIPLKKKKVDPVCLWGCLRHVTTLSVECTLQFLVTSALARNMLHQLAPLSVMAEVEYLKWESSVCCQDSSHLIEPDLPFVCVLHVFFVTPFTLLVAERLNLIYTPTAPGSACVFPLFFYYNTAACCLEPATQLEALLLYLH